MTAVGYHRSVQNPGGGPCDASTRGSPALGAAPWQVAWQIVLPAALPGVFAACVLGFGRAIGETMVVLENTPKIHNMVVCTLCSCYPWPVLGLPPVWYKSFPYRSRAVIDPRGVLKEFGLELDEDVEVRVWDSTSEVRYIVLPERPAGTEGMSEDELAEIVNRNSLIGTAKVQAPSAKGESA